jgi:hypothetical protein
MDQNFHIVSPEKEACTPRCNRTEIFCSDLLGSATLQSLIQQQRRLAVAREPHNYAVKLLKETESSKRYIMTAVDLVMEAKLLTSISHPCIVKLHGISERGIHGFGEPSGFFIILDKLVCSLEDKLKEWRRQRYPSYFDRSPGAHGSSIICFGLSSFLACSGMSNPPTWVLIQRGT